MYTTYYYAVRICGKRYSNGGVSVRLSVCLSRRSTAAASAGGFAAEVGHEPAADIDPQLLLPRDTRAA